MMLMGLVTQLYGSIYSGWVSGKLVDFRVMLSGQSNLYLVKLPP